MLCNFKILVSWLVLSLLFLASPAAVAQPPGQSIGAAEKVVGEVYGNTLLRRLKTGEDIFKDQWIKSGADGAADLRFLDRSRLTVGPKTEIVLDKFVYDPDTNSNQGTVELVRGVLRFTSASLDRGVTFKTPAAIIGIRGTTIDILVSGQSTEVVVHEGRVQVTGSHGSIFVGAGETLILTEAGPVRSNQGSPKMQSAVADMLVLVSGKSNTGSSPQEALQTPDTNQPVQQAARPQETASDTPARGVAGSGETTALEAAAVRGKDLENLLYLDLPYGRVIIEMHSDLAPRHVARIKELVRSNFYDGLKFHSVIAGRFAMTGDPTGTGRGGSGKILEAEFSDASFRRGSVGMAHDRGQPDSADSQFFISLEAFPEIDGQYTVWGQVIHGMHFIDRLRAGNPPAKPDIVLRLRIAADVTG